MDLKFLVARSFQLRVTDSQIPAWPFISASFAAGFFALLPYFALWDAPKEPLQLPPKKEDLVCSTDIA